MPTESARHKTLNGMFFTLKTFNISHTPIKAITAITPEKTGVYMANSQPTTRSIPTKKGNKVLCISHFGTKLS